MFLYSLSAQKMYNDVPRGKWIARLKPALSLNRVNNIKENENVKGLLEPQNYLFLFPTHLFEVTFVYITVYALEN